MPYFRSPPKLIQMISSLCAKSGGSYLFGSVLNRGVFAVFGIWFVASLCGSATSQIAYVNQANLIMLDLIVSAKGGVNADENILLINIDRDSMNKMQGTGRRDWRKYHSRILERVKRAKVIAFDIAFDGATEYDENWQKK